jgi:hypothetical protein
VSRAVGERSGRTAVPSRIRHNLCDSARCGEFLPKLDKVFGDSAICQSAMPR